MTSVAPAIRPGLLSGLDSSTPPIVSSPPSIDMRQPRHRAGPRTVTEIEDEDEVEGEGGGDVAAALQTGPLQDKLDNLEKRQERIENLLEKLIEQLGATSSSKFSML